MSRARSPDGVSLHYEEVGRGTAVVFVHEYAGDWRNWEPQMRSLSRHHRCVAFSARGYHPSDIPEDPDAYVQDRAREDVLAVMDALGIYTALHVGLRHPDRCLSVAALGCGWGSNPDDRPAAEASCREIARMFVEEPIAQAAATYAHAPMRLAFKAKDPRGFEEFARMLAEHSPQGSALTMANLQLRRPTLWQMEAELRRFVPPLLVLVGDGDDPCFEGSVFLKRTVPGAGLMVLPHTGHTINSEEPAAVNAALSAFFAAVESGRHPIDHLP